MAYVEPKVGDKVKFLGTRMFWFTNIIDDAKKNLTVGDVYTITEIQMASSWTGIKLKETGELIFNHAWFEIVS